MGLTELRVHEKEVEFLKTYMNFIISSFEDGACFSITDLDKTIHRRYEKFDIPGIVEGQQFIKNGIAAHVLQVRTETTLRIARNVYGIRVFAFGGPIWDANETEIIGTWGLGLPRLHKLASAFEFFSPTLADLLPEGGVMFISDKEKIIKKQASQKFDIHTLQINTPISGHFQMESITQNKQIVREFDASVFGVPVMAVSNPIADGETGEIVGSFSLALPRQLARDLKEMLVMRSGTTTRLYYVPSAATG